MKDDGTIGERVPEGGPEPASEADRTEPLPTVPGPAPSGPVPYGGPPPQGWAPQGWAPQGWTPPAPPGPAPPAYRPEPPPRTHRWGLGAYLLVEVVFLLVSVLLGFLLAGRLTTDAGAIALTLSIPTLAAAGLAMLITVVRGGGPVQDLGLRMTARDIGVGVSCGLAGLVITVPASVLYVAIVGADATSAVGQVFGNVRAGPVIAVTVFLIVVFVAPFCEEVVYRGLLWGAVEKLGARRWWAMAITTIIFALAHFELTRTPLLLVVALPIGVARVLTGRLPAGVIAHQINNLLPGVVLMLSLLGVVPMT